MASQRLNIFLILLSPCRVGELFLIYKYVERRIMTAMLAKDMLKSRFALQEFESILSTEKTL